MGPSGSGKSTLLAVLSGLLRPDTGAVGALGKDVWRMSEDEMERFRLRYCSYIFQGYNLFPALTAREQLEIVLKWGEGCSTREARKRADHVLGQLGLASKAHLRPAQMSGGEKQRVAIGRALVKNPTFVFADEPTAALDWENGQQVIKLLTENARERGAMVLVVTHDPRLVPFADKVFELTDGQLSQEGTPEEVLARPDVHEHTPPPLPARKGPRLQLHVPQPALA
jgi:putative ABC transport system ATP-binding protein